MYIRKNEKLKFVVILCIFTFFYYTYIHVVFTNTSEVSTTTLVITTPATTRKLFSTSTQKRLSIGNPTQVFVLSEGSLHTWRSLSLQRRYPNAIVTNRNKFLVHINEKSKKFAQQTPEDRYRNSRTAGAVINTINISLQYPPGWFLAFEDDAQLLDTCKEYVLPTPIPQECQFISIDPRGTNYIKHQSRKLNDHYMQSKTSAGHGTAGFWFTTSFAKHMTQIKSLNVPIDIYIYNLAPKTGSICFLSNGCIVKHNDSPSMRIWPSIPAQ